ncbi:prolyl-tRNA synthetase [Anopheles sinensis]|uniref:Prolyl-tRNA synthetase n=1 Tax=Anopheles sinensis TaxID=74873 RepID=A0A084VCK9_ANOSI|nr:prolyl-tRNA synthetase [Anopheles sinensis]
MSTTDAPAGPFKGRNDAVDEAGDDGNGAFRTYDAQRIDSTEANPSTEDGSTSEITMEPAGIAPAPMDLERQIIVLERRELKLERKSIELTKCELDLKKGCCILNAANQVKVHKPRSKKRRNGWNGRRNSGR